MMKKIVLASLICLFTSAIFAQVSSPISLGIHGGLVSTTLDTDASSYTSYSNIKDKADNGVMFGAFARINLNKWYLQPELNFVSQKAEISLTENGNEVSGDFKRKSIDVPMLLGYKLVKIPMFKLRAFAGPVASFSVDDSFTSDLKNRFNNEDVEGAVWSGKVGAGVDVWKLTLDVDYQFGLSDVSSEFLKKNKMFNVTLGFKLF